MPEQPSVLTKTIKPPRIRWTHTCIPARVSPVPTAIHEDLVAIRDAVVRAAGNLDRFFSLEDLIDAERTPIPVAARMVYAMTARTMTTRSWAEIAAAVAKSSSSVVTSHRLMKTGRGTHTRLAMRIMGLLGAIKFGSLHPQLGGNLGMQRRLLESVALAPAKGEE